VDTDTAASASAAAAAVATGTINVGVDVDVGGGKSPQNMRDDTVAASNWREFGSDCSAAGM
jgi:hypothetical protein